MEYLDGQIEEQKREIKDRYLSLEWMKQRYSQLEAEMCSEGAVMTLMLSATTLSNQNSDYSGLDIPLRMLQNICDNIGSMR